jgi:hypothetical protein
MHFLILIGTIHNEGIHKTVMNIYALNKSTVTSKRMITEYERNKRNSLRKF